MNFHIMNEIIYIASVLLVFSQICAVAGDCTTTRRFCLFCAVNASIPRYFRYIDQYLHGQVFHTYDCEEIYGIDSGSVLSPTTCECTYPDLDYTPPNDRGCRTFVIKPEDVHNHRSGKFYMDAPIGLDIRGDQMCSNNSHYLVIPYFKQNDIGSRIKLKLRFRPGKPLADMADLEEMALWTDGYCNGVDDPYPSLHISYNRTGVIVRAAGPDNTVNTLYCQPHITNEEKDRGVYNYLSPPLMNQVSVYYRAGNTDSSTGTRNDGMMALQVNDGEFKSTLSGSCFSLGIGPAKLKASSCPVRLPGKYFNGCISKVTLHRDCLKESEEEKKIFNL